MNHAVAYVPSPSPLFPRRAMAPVPVAGARRVCFGDFTFDRGDGSLSRSGLRVPLPPKARMLLELLVARAGQTVTKREILSHVWSGTFVSDAVVKVCIGQIRRALGERAGTATYLETEPRIGYRFVAAVTSPEADLDACAPLRTALDGALHGDSDGILDRALARAEEAAARRDHAARADHLATALSAARFLAPTDVRLACHLTIRLAEASAHAGQVLRAASAGGEAVALAQRTGDPILFAHAAIALGEGHKSALASQPELISILERALGALEDRGPSDLRARLRARLAYALYAVPEETQRRRALAQAALREVAGASTDAEVWVLRHALLACWGPDDLGSRRRDAERLVALSRRSSDVGDILLALGARIHFALEAGDVESADRDLAEYEQVARDAGRPWFRWAALRLRILRATIAGDFDGALAHIEEVTRVAPSEHPDVLALFFAQRLAIRMMQGDGAEVLRFLASGPSSGLPQLGTTWRCAHTQLTAARGDGTARATLRELCDDDFAAIPRDAFWTGNMTFLAEACVALEDRRLAQRVYAKLAPFADQCAILHGAVWLGSIHLPLGRLARLLGRERAAEQHLAAASALHERMGAAPLAARSRAETRAHARREAPPEVSPEAA